MYVIDRFEGDYAIIEDGNKNILNVLKNKLPSAAKEGDVVILENDIWVIDSKTTLSRKKKIEKLMNDLWE